MNIFEKQISALTPAIFNPASRTASRNIAGLVSRMRKDGFLKYCPILVTTNWNIGDGHRRYFAAIEIGIASVPCLVVPGKTAEEIWVSVNDQKRTLTSREILQAMKLGLVVIPPSKAAEINRVKDVMGDDGPALLADANLSPYTVTVGLSVARACGEPWSSDAEFRRSACVWLINHRCQKQARDILDRGAGGDKLAEYIINDLPLTPWG